MGSLPCPCCQEVISISLVNVFKVYGTFGQKKFKMLGFFRGRPWAEGPHGVSASLKGAIVMVTFTVNIT
jgi:hypothetical protein